MHSPKIETPPIVYVYQCRRGIGSAPKYYVGTTTNFSRRHAEHIGGTGCEFTKQFPNLTCISVQLGGPDVEMQIVLKYMSDHGIDNVRGGPWSQLTISPEEQARIMTQLQSIADVCYICGRAGHFASACPTRGPAPRPKPAARPRLQIRPQSPIRDSAPYDPSAVPTRVPVPYTPPTRVPAPTVPPRTEPPPIPAGVAPQMMELDTSEIDELCRETLKELAELNALLDAPPPPPPRRAIATPIDVAARIERAKQPTAPPFCHRCHRKGHLSKSCVETTNGKTGSNQICSRCSRVGHLVAACRYSCSATGVPIP